MKAGHGIGSSRIITECKFKKQGHWSLVWSYEGKKKKKKKVHEILRFISPSLHFTTLVMTLLPTVSFSFFSSWAHVSIYLPQSPILHLHTLARLSINLFVCTQKTRMQMCHFFFCKSHRRDTAKKYICGMKCATQKVI